MVAYHLNIPECVIAAVDRTETDVNVYGETQSTSARCPSCGTDSKRIHRYYKRRIMDLPLGAYSVQLNLRVKRFRCQQESCDRSTFAEQVPGMTERYSRQTKRLVNVVWHIGQVAGGRPGSRLAHTLRISVSRHRIFRVLRRIYNSVTKPVRILGLDDWAKKRGQTYGTILVDLEDHRVIDLLPNREASTLTLWLKRHPDIEIVTRDRSSEYAKGMHPQQLRWRTAGIYSRT